MRTFVALNLETAERRAVHSALEPLRRVNAPFRWVAADALHLTLKFLGDTESSYVQPLGDALGAVAAQHAPLSLRITGAGAFPSVRRASILWVGVEADPALVALQRDVENALFSLGYPRELRPFRPHVTVARLRSGARPADVSRALDTFVHESHHAVRTVDLMRSHTLPDGARYEPLLRLRLGGPDA